MTNNENETNLNEIKITRIYLVTNCYGDQNNVYIGKEKNNQKTSREGKHRKKYGQIEFSYIDKVDSWDYKDWEPLETFYIRYFKFLGFNVVNIRKKGGNGPEFLTEIQKENLRKPKSKEHGENVSKALKGRKKSERHCINISKGKKAQHLKYSEEHCLKISEGKKGHICFDNKERGNKISIALTGIIISEETKEKIRKSMLNNPKLKILRSVEAKNKMSATKTGKPKSIPIVQYTLENEFVKEWNNQKEAANFYKINPTTLSGCLRGKQKTSCGFKWKFKL